MFDTQNLKKNLAANGAVITANTVMTTLMAVIMTRMTETMALMRKISIMTVMRNRNLETSTIHLLMTVAMVIVMTITVMKVVMIAIIIAMMIQ